MDTKRPTFLVEVVDAEDEEYIGRVYDFADPSGLEDLFSSMITRRPDGQRIFPSTMVIENIDRAFRFWELVPLLEATMKAIIREWLLEGEGLTNGAHIKDAMKLCEEFPAMAAMAKLKGKA